MEYNNDLLNQLELTISNAIEVERDYKNTIKILQEENDLSLQKYKRKLNIITLLFILILLIFVIIIKL